jgi:hypothetical protein
MLTFMTLGASCGLRGHSIDFAPLERADRMEVRTRDGALVKTIRDGAQIRQAIAFIERYQSGWKDPVTGPVVPTFMLTFFKGDEGISGFGVGGRYIVSHPPTAGFWSRTVPEEEATRLLEQLGLNQVSKN